MTSPSALFACASSLLFFTAIACSTAPKSTGERADLEARSVTTLDNAKRADPTIARQIDAAEGVAVFPRVSKGAAGVGGAYGKGTVWSGGRLVGYCDLSQATVGAQLGGQTYAEILVFKTKDAFEQFKQGTFAFDAQASAVAVRSGAAANASYSRGVAVFTMDEAGLMFEASVGGQRFTFESV